MRRIPRAGMRWQRKRPRRLKRGTDVGQTSPPSVEWCFHFRRRIAFHRDPPCQIMDRATFVWRITKTKAGPATPRRRRNLREASPRPLPVSSRHPDGTHQPLGADRRRYGKETAPFSNRIKQNGLRLPSGHSIRKTPRPIRRLKAEAEAVRARARRGCGRVRRFRRDPGPCADFG